MVQRVRLTRLDVVLILILVVAGASVWPVTSALVAISQQDQAPRELHYQTNHQVHALRIRLKGLEDQLGKAREKVIEQHLDAKSDPADIERVRTIASGYEANVLDAALALARAESAAARAHARDLQWHEWKSMGVTMSAAAISATALLAVFVLIASPLLGLARLTPSWSRVLPASAAIVLLAMAYQAGQVSGLIAFVFLVTMAGAVWALVSSFRSSRQTAQS